MSTAFWPTIAEVLEVEGANSIYISGPMTYIPQGNAPAFDACASALRAVEPHLNVWSPAEMDRARGFDIDGWDGHSATATDINVILAEDIGVVCEVDLLVLLPGWEDSSGATLEIAVAVRLGKPVYLWDPETETLCQLELSSIIAVCHQSGHTLHGRLA